MLFNYKSKKEMKEKIGNNLDYTETSMFGEEYRSNGTFVGSNRPHITGIKGREFFAEVVMRDDKIASVK
jgi:hypothetical protein|tara:strand:- start:154 stop:360 length:207 start_codon:yes stop_codon:yes gene_type:complete